MNITCPHCKEGQYSCWDAPHKGTFSMNCADCNKEFNVFSVVSYEARCLDGEHELVSPAHMPHAFCENCGHTESKDKLTA